MCLFIYLYILATQQNSKMITREDNKLIHVQIKRQGKRKDIYTIIRGQTAGRPYV